MVDLFKAARKVLVRMAVPAAVFAVAACEPVAIAPGSNSGQRVNTSAPVPVALLVPGGSAQPGDDLLASSLENAARLAMADLNGVEIDLQVYNTGGTAAGASAAASTAISSGAKVILGPVYAEAANSVGLIAAQKNVNVLAFSNNPSVAGGNVFVLGPLYRTTAKRLLSYAGRQGKKSVVVVRPQSVDGEFGVQAITQAQAGSGVSISSIVSYEFSQQGVVAAIPQIKAAAANADAVFMTSNTAAALPLFSQLLPEAGVNPVEKQFIGLTRWDIPAQTLELPGVQGGWFALPDPARTAQFGSRYQATYSAQPHPISGLAYDGIAAIGALVAAGKSDALTVQALTQSQGFEGVNGIFRLNPDGTNDRGLAVATIRDQNVVVIDSAPRSFIGAGL